MSGAEGVEGLRGPKVYIAARFSRRPECNALGHILKAKGCTITSRWIKPDADHVLPTGLSRQAEDSERQRFALEDVDDVRAADWTISLMEEPRSNTRGGRHIEFGLAVALEHRLTIIGPRETVFHHLPNVEHFDTVEAFVASLPERCTRLSTSSDAGRGDREAIAEVISGLRRERIGKAGCDGPVTKRVWADALAKADAILALPSATQPPERARDGVKMAPWDKHCFEYPNPPQKWDRGPVLLRNGTWEQPNGHIANWQHFEGAVLLQRDIIFYFEDEESSVATQPPERGAVEDKQS